MRSRSPTARRASAAYRPRSASSSPSSRPTPSSRYARRYYNGTVRDWNNLVERIPSNIVAGLAGKKTEPFFQLDDADEAAVPRIDFEEEEA